ncbi:MAG TPA: hypothetical protein PK462_09055 [Lachnospira sp.]|nr:hypothetical protein [Lachnospira sp.]
MNTITLHMENRADNTAVSNYFIDTLMPQANGEFVKIYLYLLRCVSAGHISLSVSEMADLFNQTGGGAVHRADHRHPARAALLG